MSRREEYHSAVAALGAIRAQEIEALHKYHRALAHTKRAATEVKEMFFDLFLIDHLDTGINITKDGKYFMFVSTETADRLLELGGDDESNPCPLGSNSVSGMLRVYPGEMTIKCATVGTVPPRDRDLLIRDTEWRLVHCVFHDRDGALLYEGDHDSYTHDDSGYLPGLAELLDNPSVVLTQVGDYDSPEYEATVKTGGSVFMVMRIDDDADDDANADADDDADNDDDDDDDDNDDDDDTPAGKASKDD
jgi:hypothetical protein